MSCWRRSRHLDPYMTLSSSKQTSCIFLEPAGGEHNYRHFCRITDHTRPTSTIKLNSRRDLGPLNPADRVRFFLTSPGFLLTVTTEELCHEVFSWSAHGRSGRRRGVRATWRCPDPLLLERLRNRLRGAPSLRDRSPRFLRVRSPLYLRVRSPVSLWVRSPPAVLSQL